MNMNIDYDNKLEKFFEQKRKHDKYINSMKKNTYKGKKSTSKKSQNTTIEITPDMFRIDYGMSKDKPLEIIRKKKFIVDDKISHLQNKNTKIKMKLLHEKYDIYYELDNITMESEAQDKIEHFEKVQKDLIDNEKLISKYNEQKKLKDKKFQDEMNELNKEKIRIKNELQSLGRDGSTIERRELFINYNKISTTITNLLSEYNSQTYFELDSNIMKHSTRNNSNNSNPNRNIISVDDIQVENIEET